MLTDIYHHEFAEKIRRRIPLEYAPRESGFDYRFSTNDTQLCFHTAGLGDEMMVRQLGGAFTDYLADNPDPELGSVTIINGGYAPESELTESRTNVYWWYSFGPYDDDPSRYHDEYLDPHVDFDLDLILCGSRQIQEEAEQLGYETLYFPIGTHGFRNLGLRREGFGYAGSKHHKDSSKVEQIMGEYVDREDFEWVDDLTDPRELNLWYNRQFVTFGLTKEGQRQWGVVNSRVFEALGSATPFIIRDHPTLEDTLGFEYPYQAESQADVREIVDRFVENRESVLEEFAEFSERIHRNHNYTVRLETLFDHLS